MSASTEDRFLAGRLTLQQPADGYRAGLDAMLLAAAAGDLPASTCLDVGCGVGAVMLAMAVRRPDCAHLGLERDPDAIRLCHANIAFNGLSGSASVEAGDHLARGGPVGFDLVVSNPPFFDDGSAIRGPSRLRRGAYLMDAPLQDWVRGMLRRAGSKGALVLIHRADRLADILTALAGKAGDIRVLPIRPRAGSPAKRVIVSARKGTRAPLSLLPGLDLHPSGADGRFTPEAEAIFSGATLLQALSGSDPQGLISTDDGGSENRDTKRGESGAGA